MAIKFSDLPYLSIDSLSLGSIIPIVQNGENFKIALSSINASCNQLLTVHTLKACTGSDTIQISANIDLNGYSINGVSDNSITFKSGATMTSNEYGGVAIVPAQGKPVTIGATPPDQPDPDSDNWDNTYTAVSANSAAWNDTYTTTSSNSALWTWSGDTVSARSYDWDQAAIDVQENRLGWDEAADLLAAVGDVAVITQLSAAGSVAMLSGGCLVYPYVTVPDIGNIDDYTTYPGKPADAPLLGGVDYGYYMMQTEVPLQAVYDYNIAVFGGTTSTMLPEARANLPCGYYLPVIPGSWPIDEDKLNKPAILYTWQWAMLVNYMNEAEGLPPAYIFKETTSEREANPGPGRPPWFNTNTNPLKEWEPGDVGYTPGSRWRNAQAAFFIPTEDEWYKTAYYDPTLGCYGNGSYWFYATQQEYGDEPTSVTSGTALSTAMFNHTAGTAPVSAAGGPSYYQTIGQDGNAQEQMFLSIDDHTMINQRGSSGQGTYDPGKNSYFYSDKGNRTGLRFVKLIDDRNARATAMNSLSSTIKGLKETFQDVIDGLPQIESVAAVLSTLSACGELNECTTAMCSAMKTSEYYVETEGEPISFTSVITEYDDVASDAVRTKKNTTQQVSHIVQMSLTDYLGLSTLPPSHSDHGPKAGWLYIINDL